MLTPHYDVGRRQLGTPIAVLRPVITIAASLPDVKALARAWRWQRLLDDGVYSSVSEIGDAENISKSYVRCSNRAWA